MYITFSVLKGVRAMRFFALVGAVSILGLAFSSAIQAQGTAVLMTSKSIPASTVSVIDPESGISRGGGSTDIRLAAGDIIQFRFNFTPISKQGARAMQGYLTEYIPPNTEVVGVRIIDQNGVTIPPRYPGISFDPCHAPDCKDFDDMPCSGTGLSPECISGTRDLSSGSISQLYADTGVFYTNDARLDRDPNDIFIALSNGITMDPEPVDVGAMIAVLNTASPIYAHNAWDWWQMMAYGAKNVAYSGNNGSGTTPYLYGSPVAGPDVLYIYEYSYEEAPLTVEFNDVEGPWNRIRYPGALVGTGDDTYGYTFQRTTALTEEGVIVSPANPITGASAIRFALGEMRIGEPGTVEIALRVLDTPLDPRFNPDGVPPVEGGDVDCGEVFGSDISAKSDGDATSNPWSNFLPSPNCVFLKLLFNITVDKPLMDTPDVATYTVRVKNLSLDDQENVLILKIGGQGPRGWGGFGVG